MVKLINFCVYVVFQLVHISSLLCHNFSRPVVVYGLKYLHCFPQGDYLAGMVNIVFFCIHTVSCTTVY